jgi:dUTPase
MKISCIYDVKPPSRGTPKSAGLDFYIPQYSPEFQKAFLLANGPNSMADLDVDHDQIMIPPHGKVMIPLGVKVEVPEGTALIAFNKTGVSWDYSLARLSSVVDEDYQGMLFLTGMNYSNAVTILKLGQKIIQLLVIPVIYEDVELVDEKDIHIQPTIRGVGALGSTGKF